MGANLTKQDGVAESSKASSRKEAAPRKTVERSIPMVQSFSYLFGSERRRMSKNGESSSATGDETLSQGTGSTDRSPWNTPPEGGAYGDREQTLHHKEPLASLIRITGGVPLVASGTPEAQHYGRFPTWHGSARPDGSSRKSGLPRSYEDNTGISERRPKTAPVKCPSRKQVHPFTSSHTPPPADHSGSPQDQDLERLQQDYDLRTWDMFIRITQARKQKQANEASNVDTQKMEPVYNRNHQPIGMHDCGNTLLQQGHQPPSIWLENPPDTDGADQSHEMIFGDLD